MRYSEIKPRPPVSRFVECFWTLESEVPSPQPERILPDGCVELILNFGSEFSQHGESGCTRQPRNFLVGQMTGPILISPTGPVQALGIRFHPGGTLPFLRTPLDEVTDQVVDLGGLSSKLERGLLAAASQVSLLSEKIAAVESFLIACVTANHRDSKLMMVAARIVGGAGMVSVDPVANDAGIS